MRGYKGMRKDMTCRNMQYEVGKSYHIDGDIKPCENGFHFCNKLSETFCHYSIYEGSRYFEVEASGTIIIEEGRHPKNVASDIKIVREVTPLEISTALYERHKKDYRYFQNDGYETYNKLRNRRIELSLNGKDFYFLEISRGNGVLPAMYDYSTRPYARYESGCGFYNIGSVLGIDPFYQMGRKSFFIGNGDIFNSYDVFIREDKDGSN